MGPRPSGSPHVMYHQVPSQQHQQPSRAGRPGMPLMQPSRAVAAPLPVQRNAAGLGPLPSPDVQQDEQLQSLKELRKTSGFKQIPVSEALRTLKAAASDNKLSREEFVAAYEQLVLSQNIEVPSESVRNAVFDVFDKDHNNVVDMMELICGISLLCGGSEEEKIHSIFEIFDENGDGYISMDEMFKFLTSVFNVVLTPHVMSVMTSMGVTVESAEDLASVTALECFKSADLNHDGKLSVAEFKTWFYAPRNDPSLLFSPVRKLLQ